VSISVNGGAEVNAYQTIGFHRRHLGIPKSQNNPVFAEQFDRTLEIPPGEAPKELSLTSKWDGVARRRADLAWLKAAYIATFACWATSIRSLPHSASSDAN
jgi:hypothetical protein